MSNGPRAARRAKTKRKSPERYNAAELHGMCVDDYLSGVHTGQAGQAALGWFAQACARIGHLRGITTDQAFLEVVHDAEVKAGRPLL